MCYNFNYRNKLNGGIFVLKVEYVEKLNNEMENLIDSEFEKHASKFGLKCNYKKFNFIAKVNGEIAGFITGVSLFESVHINELIVIEKYRGNNIGTELIKKVENYHSNKNFKYIELVTNKYQAPDFYKKCGFKLEFIRENKENSKLTKYFFIKYF